jgi:thiamine biosynthesis lipoprotein ApbE
MIDPRTRHVALTSHVSRRRLLASLGGASIAWWTKKDLAADSGPETQPFEEVEFPAMGSLINIRWEAHPSIKVTPQHIKSHASKVVETWNDILSDYDDESEIASLAKQADNGSWQTVSEKLAIVMQLSSDWYAWSEGAFDVAIGALTSLRRKRKLPRQEAWDAARERTGWKLVEWNPRQRLCLSTGSL